MITGLKESAVDLSAKATMVEYLYASLDYYFLTSRANEIALLDSVPAFTRTGQSIPVFANRAAGTQPITRFRFDKIALKGARDGHLTKASIPTRFCHWCKASAARARWV